MWAAAAAFADLFAVVSPPTHNDLDIAFRRAGVSSPQGDGVWSISKAKRVLAAFDQTDGDTSGHLEALIRSLTTALTTKGVFEWPDERTKSLLEQLRKQLDRIGWGLSEAGTLTPLGIIDVQVRGRDALEQQLKRLRDSGDDISLMLGAAKDALEAAAKFVLEERGQSYQPDESLDALVNRAMKLAGISTRPADVTSEASKALATINQTVPKIAEAVRKVRNDQGSGHGRTAMATMSKAEAAFIRDLTLSVVQFVLSEHDSRPHRAAMSW